MIQFRMHSNIGVLIIILPRAIVTVKAASLFGGGQLSIPQTSGGISRGRLACQTAGCLQEQKKSPCGGRLEKPVSSAMEMVGSSAAEWNIVGIPQLRR